MDNETAGSAASESTPNTLGSDVSGLFGDMIYTEPAEKTPDAGTPPADTPPATSEGAEAPAAAGEPPAKDAAAAPDQAGTQPTDDDPLKDAQPFSYTVNGQSRTLDGVTVLAGGQGAIVDADALPKLVRLASERDNLYERQQSEYKLRSELEKAAEWHVLDDKGQIARTLTGRDAIVESRLAYARQAAELSHYNKLLSDPATLASLLTFNEQTGQYGWNENATGRILAELRASKMEVENAVRQHYGPFARSEPAAPFNATAPEAKTAAVAIAAQSAGVTLSPEDKAWAEGIAPRYVRTATAEDVKASPNLKLGEPIVDAEFADLIKDRAALRAEATKKAQAAATTAKENAGKLAAASLGKNGNGQRPAAPATRQATSDDEELSPEDHAFLARERAAAAAMRPYARA